MRSRRLRRRCFVRPIALAVVVLALALSLSGCCKGQICKREAAIVTIATVGTVDEAIGVFAKWAAAEEAKIAEEAIKKCSPEATRGAYLSCASEYASKRREPIDRTRTAIVVYGAALSAAQGAVTAVTTRDLAAAAASVTEAVAALGIVIQKATSAPAPSTAGGNP